MSTTPSPGNPTGANFFVVHRLEKVRVTFRSIEASSPEAAAVRSDEADLHRILDYKNRNLTASSFDRITFNGEGPELFVVEPLDDDGFPQFDFTVWLAEDREGRLYRMPPSLTSLADDAAELLDRILELKTDGDAEKNSRLFQAIHRTAQQIRVRHSASGT